jgi:biotin operon repressor
MDAIYGEMPSYNPKTNTISAYDYLVANAGGHKCITTISGIGFVYSGYDKPYTKDLPAEAIPIAYYEGSNTFIQDIKQKLLRFRTLSEKQIQAAISGMKREGIDVESLANPKQGRGTTELTKDIRDKFIEILNEKIKNSSQQVSESKIRVKKKLFEVLDIKNLYKLINESEKKSWSKGLFQNGDGITTPKITINKTDSFFDIKYEGPESGFNIESAVLNPNDSIHQLSNVFTYEVNKHLKSLYQKGVYVQPDMENIEMVKKPNYFEIKVQFDEVDKENAITRMDRRGGMGHNASKGKSLMEKKCDQYAGCEKVYTVKAGSITEHFVSYRKKPKNQGDESDSNFVDDLEKVFEKKETFEKQEKPYSYEEGVELIQTALQFLGFSLPEWGVDGKFGPETEKAVMDFQDKNSIEPTGVADQETIAKIIEKVDEENFEDEDMSKIQKSKSKSLIDDDDKIPTNIVIGDSQAPYVANGSTQFDLISSQGSEDSLWLGGKTLSWLLSALKKHKGSSNVENIAIVIGTNGNFNTNEDISGLITEIESKFPNAELFVVQGSWGWGGLKNTTEQKVRKYYQKFKDLGVTVIEPPIGNIEPHGNKPIYKKIGSNLDSKI